MHISREPPRLRKTTWLHYATGPGHPDLAAERRGHRREEAGFFRSGTDMAPGSSRPSLLQAGAPLELVGIHEALAALGHVDQVGRTGRPVGEGV